MRPTKWRRQWDRKYSEAAHSFKILVGAMRRFQSALPADEAAARDQIGDAVRDAHSRWSKENASREACDEAIDWLCRLSLIAVVANVEVYLREIESRVPSVPRKPTSQDTDVSKLVKQAFFVQLALDRAAPPLRVTFTGLPDELKVLELFVRMRHRVAHADGSAGKSVQSCLRDPALEEAWKRLGTTVARGKSQVPPIPTLSAIGMPTITPELTVYAGIVAKHCIAHVDELFCSRLSEREKLELAVRELEHRARIARPEPAHLESWVRHTLVYELCMDRFREPAMCKPGALARELRQLGVWARIPGSRKDSGD